MKYIVSFLIFLALLFFFWKYDNAKDWKISQSSMSPDQKMLAIVKRYDSGGATVGTYCKLYFVNENNASSEMMMARTPDIKLSWIGSNILKATISQESKIHNFTNFIWNHNNNLEYYIRLNQE